MNLSSFFQTPEFLASLPAAGRKELRGHILSKGNEWFEAHPGESSIIEKNLAAFGMSHDPAFLDNVKTNVLLHYYEKLLPLCLSPQEYRDYLMERVTMPKEFTDLKKSALENSGVLCAVCHFGAVELIGPALAAAGLSFTGALRFSTKHLSEAVRERSDRLAATGLFAPMGFVEIGGANPAAALDMAAVLRRGGMLLAVFDEKQTTAFP